MMSNEEWKEKFQVEDEGERPSWAKRGQYQHRSCFPLGKDEQANVRAYLVTVVTEHEVNQPGPYVIKYKWGHDVVTCLSAVHVASTELTFTVIRTGRSPGGDPPPPP